MIIKIRNIVDIEKDYEGVSDLNRISKNQPIER
jgi:hypothetical protein